MENLIEVRGLCKRYKNFSLEGVDLTLPAREYGVQVRVGDTDSVSDDASLDAGLPVAWEGSINGEQVVTLDESVSGQYVLIWFTSLPTDDGRYRGSIVEVEVRGL